MSRPRTRVSAVTLSSPDTRALAAFYERLLGWTRVDDKGAGSIRPPSGGTGLSFHHEDHYARPVWPSEPGEPLMMVHLDIAVDDLDAGVAWAREAGATVAEHQPQPHVRVTLDPDGHPFCLFRGAPRGEFDQADWNGVSEE